MGLIVSHFLRIQVFLRLVPFGSQQMIAAGVPARLSQCCEGVAGDEGIRCREKAETLLSALTATSPNANQDPR